MDAINFYIGLNIKTSDGFQTFGKFFLGSDIRFADNIFRKMKGTKKITKDTIINLELTETKNELPQNIQMISCTLEELAENCKIITREIFKFFNMAET
jgi:hypothetical protein